ncbi:MAG: response regulator transcription factor [Chloroflexi bacterium]|nr:response regulator transcription factor [Chloroflexota bacterium]
MTRILIVDDQIVVSEGLKAILSATPGIEVVGIAQDGAQALELVATTKPELVLMDLKMPGMNGIHATRKIREQYPDVRILVLTTYVEDEWVFDAIQAGAAGYLLKDSRREDIVNAIQHTMAGQTPVDPAVADKLFALVRGNARPTSQTSTIANELNEREREILQLLARGMSNAAIAERLVLAEGTVRNYVSSIFAKLNVTDRTQAAALAWQHGLVSAKDE